jgi:hypothetical protein
MNTIIYNKNVSRQKFNEIISWCREYFGPGPIIYSHINAELHRWSYDSSLGVIKIIYIKDDLDYMLFQLRWS